MKKVLILAAVALSFSAFGCSKDKEAKAPVQQAAVAETLAQVEVYHHVYNENEQADNNQRSICKYILIQDNGSGVMERHEAASRGTGKCDWNALKASVQPAGTISNGDQVLNLVGTANVAASASPKFGCTAYNVMTTHARTAGVVDCTNSGRDGAGMNNKVGQQLKKMLNVH